MQGLILDVDDEPKIVKQARDYLENSGFRVVAAGDGRTALAAARRERPDLVVLDLNLPGMDGLEIDVHGHRVTRDGEPLHLTRTEFDLLVALAQHPGQAFTREQLLNRLHGVAYDGYDRSIDAHVKNLRQKIEPDPGDPRCVLTVYGVGYRFTDEV